MINLPEDAWVMLRDKGWAEGLRAVCKLKVEAAQRALARIDPTDVVGIARLQQEIDTYTNDIPSIEVGLSEFQATENAARRAR